jgi:hypothetical protein
MVINLDGKGEPLSGKHFDLSPPAGEWRLDHEHSSESSFHQSLRHEIL